MSKLAKGDHLVFLAIKRETNEASPMKKSNKRSSARAVRAFLQPTSMSEGKKWSINKKEGPKIRYYFGC